MPKSNEKTVNILLANSASETSNGIIMHDSVIVDVELVKQSSANNRLSLSLRENEQSLLQSNESVINDKKLHAYGFPTSTWAQFWILLKRTFLTIFRGEENKNLQGDFIFILFFSLKKTRL